MTHNYLQAEADMLQLLKGLSEANAITETQMSKVCVRQALPIVHLPDIKAKEQ